MALKLQQTKILSGLDGVTHLWWEEREGHHRIVDVGRERTLILCRKCAVWESEKRLGKTSKGCWQARRLEAGVPVEESGARPQTRA